MVTDCEPNYNNDENVSIKCLYSWEVVYLFDLSIAKAEKKTFIEKIIITSFNHFWLCECLRINWFLPSQYCYYSVYNILLSYLSGEKSNLILRL